MHFAKVTAVVVVFITFSIGATATWAQVSYHWNDPTGGTFQDPTKWDLFSVPGPLDQAVFSTPGFGYNVFFDSSATTDRATILGDDVVFDLQGRVYTLLGVGGEGLRVEQLLGTGSLEIIDGRVNADGGVFIDAGLLGPGAMLHIHDDGKLSTDVLNVGENNSGTLVVENDGLLEVSGGLLIGRYGYGDVFVDGNLGPAVVQNGVGTVLANDPTSVGADVFLDGPGALWQTPVVFMGRSDGTGGSANISVANGAQLSVTGPIYVGNSPGTTLDLSGATITAGRINVVPGGTFNFWSGTLELTDSDLTVDTGELLGSNVTVNLGDRIAVSGTTTVESGGLIDINGGSFSTGILDVQGDPSRLSWLAGGLELTASDLVVGPGELLGGSIWIDPARSLTVGGTTLIDPGGFVSVAGGSFSTGAVDTQGDPSRFFFNFGEFNLTASDLTVDSSGLLGDFIWLDSSQSLGVSGLTTVGPTGYLEITGGTFSTGALDFAGDPARFNWPDGTLNLTASDLDVSLGGQFGDTLVLDSVHTLGVNGELRVAPGGTLHVELGALTVGQSTDHPGATTLRLDEGGLLDVAGAVVVGSAGFSAFPGVFAVESDGVVELTGGHLRAMDIDLALGAVFDWQTGTLELTQADLFVDPSGRLGDQLLIEGGQELILGEELFPGPGYLFVGGLAGAGELIVREGGAVTTEGGLVDFNGVATVQGGGSRWIVRDILDVVNGVLTVEAGALVQASMASVHSDGTGPGLVIVEGPDSHLEVLGTFDIVDEGRLVVRDGATAQTDHVSMLDFGGAFGPQAVVQGPGSLWRIDLMLDIGADPSALNTSFVYVIQGGTLDAGHGVIALQDMGELTIDDGLVVADSFDIAPSATLLGNGPGSVLRVNRLNYPTSIFSFNGDLQIGHAAGLGIGSHQSIGETLSVTGDLVVGYNAPATVDLDNSNLTCQNAVIGLLPLGDGTVTLSNNSSWNVLGSLTIGKEGSGVLHQNIEPITVNLDITLGDLADSSGDVLTDNSLLTSGGILTVGRAGAGNMTVQNGGSAEAAQIVIGTEATSTGDVTVDHSTMLSLGSLEVGRAGDATLTIQNLGEVYNTVGIIGADAGSSSSVTVSTVGSLWENSGPLFVGGDPCLNDGGGQGTLTINFGGRVTSMGGHLAKEPGSTGTVFVDGPSSSWTNCCSLVDSNEWITVGIQGAGAIHITNGGLVESGVISVGTSLPLGSPTASGVVTVDGTNSLLDAWGLLMVGGLGSGDVTASNEAHIHTGSLKVLGRGNLRIETAATITTDVEVFIGQSGGDLAEVVITGPGSTWTNTGTLTVGDQADGLLTVENQATMTTGVTDIGFNSGNGLVRVTSDAQLDIDGALTVGFFTDGELTISNGGRVEVIPGAPEIRVGFLPTGNGLIEVTGLGSTLDTSSQDIHIGSAGGTGVMNIRDHGGVTSIHGVVGVDVGGEGTVFVENPGSTWNLAGNLTVGVYAFGALDVRDSAAVTSDRGLIGQMGGSLGSAQVTGNTTNWNMTNDLIVGVSGEGLLAVSDGGHVSNSFARIATGASSVGHAEVSGTGSTWDNTGSLYVGGGLTTAGGNGTLSVGNGLGTGGTVNIGGDLKVWGPGTVHLNGGTINTARLLLVEGTWTWGSGELNLTDPGFEFVVGAAGPFGASLTIPTDSRMTVAGQTTVENGAVLNAVDYIGYGHAVNEGTIISSGDVILGNTSIYQAYSGGGSLVVGANNVTLKSLGFLKVDFPLSIAGGTLTAPNGLLIDPGYMLAAHGEIDARLAVPLGTTITATGNLALGDASQADGFFSDGVLNVGNHTVTLNDANLAVLGSVTTLGGGGMMIAGNGVLVEFGKNVNGFGSIDTPNDPLTPTINNGDITGNGLVEPIVLSGYVKGVGTFDNVTFTGTFAPGFSPATLYLGSAQYAGTLAIEIGGLTEGTSDLLHHSGDVVLGGVLDVSLWDGFVPMPGSVIDIITYQGELSGSFTDVVNSTGYTGLILGYTSDADSVMITTDYLAGDLNLDGFVGVDDLNIVLIHWNQNVTPGDIFQGDPTGEGFVGVDDLNVVLVNWNNGTPPPAEASGTIPEPGSVTLLLGSLIGLIARRRR